MNPRNPVILCVDDEEANLKLLANILVPRGYTVVSASSGEEALLKIKSQTIDLVLLDIIMPGMDGFEVCRQIKEDQKLRNIPVILITVLTAKKDRISGIKAGADEFLSKPFDQTEALARIKILLKVKKLDDERKRAESQGEAALEEIRRKAKELREKNEELERFTYSVSHDLKSPLVTILTFLGHLEQDMAGMNKEQVKQDLGYIRIGAEKMSRLLDELLALSQVGRKINPPEEVPLQTIVKEASGLVAGRITERGVEVKVTKAELVLWGDRVRLVEVFQNLLDNACKFMGEQKSPLVEIGVETKDGEAVIFVRDNGSGITPQFLPKLFIMFEKLNRGSVGEGIGLALVKRIVEVHGGRIWAESTVGKGSTFQMELPIRAEARKAAE